VPNRCATICRPMPWTLVLRAQTMPLGTAVSSCPLPRRSLPRPRRLPFLQPLHSPLMCLNRQPRLRPPRKWRRPFLQFPHRLRGLRPWPAFRSQWKGNRIRERLQEVRFTWSVRWVSLVCWLRWVAEGSCSLPFGDHRDAAHSRLLIVRSWLWILATLHQACLRRYPGLRARQGQNWGMLCWWEQGTRRLRLDLA
jgi:hypothetical protein